MIESSVERLSSMCLGVWVEKLEFLGGDGENLMIISPFVLTRL